MMYKEFLDISGVNYNEYTGEDYMNSIEPVYQCSPESMFKDKRDFVGWWKKNISICAWFCKVLKMKDNMQKDMQGMCEQKVELEAKIAEQAKVIEDMKKSIEEHVKFEKELETSRDDALYALQLRIAFAPDRTMNEMRLLFFPKYEEAKQDAINQGIIYG